MIMNDTLKIQYYKHDYDGYTNAMHFLALNLQNIIHYYETVLKISTNSQQNNEL